VLASDSVVISDQLLVERYGESLFAATGFTKTAELINGRLAMLGCVAALGAAGKGDVLVQLARAPMGVALVFALVATGTLVPQIDAEAGYSACLRFRCTHHLTDARARARAQFRATCGRRWRSC